VAGAHGGAFRQMLCHPKLLPYYEALCGRGYRLDHSPFVLQQRSGAEGFVLHGGATGDDGRPDWELAYGCANGAIRCNLLAASLQLVDTASGDGGFVLLRGSHKVHLDDFQSKHRGRGFLVPNERVHLAEHVCDAGLLR
jgi:hypothetical protein